MNNQILWIIFSIIFLALAIFHFYQSTRNIPKLKNKGGIKAFNGIKLGMTEFVEDFGLYVDNNNKTNRITNIIAGTGYLVALCTSIYSYCLSL